MLSIRGDLCEAGAITLRRLIVLQESMKLMKLVLHGTTFNYM